jgi:hypothetical protein
MKKERPAVAGGYINNPTTEIEIFPIEKKIIHPSNTTAYYSIPMILYYSLFLSLALHMKPNYVFYACQNGYLMVFNVVSNV